MKRHPAIVSCGLEHRLRMYARAASATGVGMLALAKAGEAKIVYTPAHVAINSDSNVPLDLNHDGVVDFNFTNTHVSSYSNFWLLSVAPAQANEVWGHTDNSYDAASALFRNVRVGDNQHFAAGRRAMATLGTHSATCEGPWANVHHRYLGLKFAIKGQIHFGWARLNVSCPYAGSGIQGTLTGYAYETVPNRPIVTGKRRGANEMGEGSQSAGSPTSSPSAAGLGRLARGAAIADVRKKPSPHQ